MILLLIGLGGSAALAADLEGSSTLPRQLLVATMAAAGSVCGFVAVQTAFRMGRLARNREALQPKEPTTSCLIAGWRLTTGFVAFGVKGALGIGLWFAVFQFSQDALR